MTALGPPPTPSRGAEGWKIVGRFRCAKGMKQGVVLAFVTALAGCGGPAPPPPAVLDLVVQGGADQNPSRDGMAAPVAIRLYQLASLGKFERTDVFALTDKAAATLGSDLLGDDEVIVAPGEKRPMTSPLKPGTHFLGAAALFRDIDHAQWRTSAPVAESGPSKLALRVSGLTITLAARP